MNKNRYLEITKLINDELEIIKDILNNDHTCPEEIRFIFHLAKKLPKNLELSEELVKSIYNLPYYIRGHDNGVYYINKNIQETIKQLQKNLISNLN